MKHCLWGWARNEIIAMNSKPHFLWFAILLSGCGRVTEVTTAWAWSQRWSRDHSDSSAVIEVCRHVLPRPLIATPCGNFSDRRPLASCIGTSCLSWRCTYTSIRDSIGHTSWLHPVYKLDPTFRTNCCAVQCSSADQAPRHRRMDSARLRTLMPELEHTRRFVKVCKQREDRRTALR